MPDFRIDKIKSAADLPAVIMLAGAESYLLDKYTEKIIATGVPDDLREFNLDLFYGAEVGARQVVDVASSYPMMAEKRLVILRDFNKMIPKDQKLLLGYVNKPSPTTCLVLVSRNADSRAKTMKDLRAKAAFVSCKPMYENNVVKWIEKEIQAGGYFINPDATSLLVLQVGTSLQALKNEIEKILLYLGDEKTITREIVEEVAGVRKDYSPFAFQNALGARELEKALQIYHQIKYSNSNLALLAQLSRLFTNILIATGFDTSRQSNATLAQKTKMSPYFVNDLHKFKRKYSVGELFSALENIRHVDYILKLFPVNPESIMELLFVQIVKGYPAKRLPYAGKIS